jgi:hypothetical protein
MPGLALSARPFQVARPGQGEGKSVAHAYVGLACSRELLRQKLPSLFLGEQHHELIPLSEQTEMLITARSPRPRQGV